MNEQSEPRLESGVEPSGSTYEKPCIVELGELAELTSYHVSIRT